MGQSNPIGIMQGRLVPRYNGRYQSFPPHTWQKEFPLACSIGFTCIEFIYDFENFEESPLVTDGGLEKIRTVSTENRVEVVSICADYFMRYPVFGCDERSRQDRIQRLLTLITLTSRIGVKDITVPCVDESSLKSEENIRQFVSGIEACLPEADARGININLETDLGPPGFQDLLSLLDHPRVKVNYDIGNSASLGYDPEEELQTYGTRISILHVKDRVRGGASVKLGTGDSNFETVFRQLKAARFRGPIIMQAARAEQPDEDIRLVTEQFAFMKECLARWFE